MNAGLAYRDKLQQDPPEAIGGYVSPASTASPGTSPLIRQAKESAPSGLRNEGIYEYSPVGDFVSPCEPALIAHSLPPSFHRFRKTKRSQPLAAEVYEPRNLFLTFTFKVPTLHRLLRFGHPLFNWLFNSSTTHTAEISCPHPLFRTPQSRRFFLFPDPRQRIPRMDNSTPLKGPSQEQRIP